MSKIIYDWPNFRFSTKNLNSSGREVKVGFVKSLVAEKDVRLAVTWATEYFTSDGTFATPTQIEEEGNFKSCHMTVADVKSFDPEVLKDPWFLDVDLGLIFCIIF